MFPPVCFPHFVFQYMTSIISESEFELSGEPCLNSVVVRVVIGSVILSSLCFVYSSLDSNILCKKKRKAWLVFEIFILCTSNRFSTAMLWYIELQCHTRMSCRILNKDLNKTITYDKLGQFPVTLNSESIVTTMCGKHCSASPYHGSNKIL